MHKFNKVNDYDYDVYDAYIQSQMTKIPNIIQIQQKQFKLSSRHQIIMSKHPN